MLSRITLFYGEVASAPSRNPASGGSADHPPPSRSAQAARGFSCGAPGQACCGQTAPMHPARLARDACPVPLSAPFGRGPEHYGGNRSWRAWTGLTAQSRNPARTTAIAPDVVFLATRWGPDHLSTRPLSSVAIGRCHLRSPVPCLLNTNLSAYPSGPWTGWRRCMGRRCRPSATHWRVSPPVERRRTPKSEGASAIPNFGWCW